MAYLPNEPVTFTGGCHCRAIRYKISVPALENRPQIPGIPDTIIQDTTEDGKNVKRKVPTACPFVLVDHCGICRHVAGTPLQFWFVTLTRWVGWTLEPRYAEGKNSSGERIVKPAFNLSSTDVCGPDAVTKNIVASTYLSQYSSSPEVTRTFCSRCGTNLSYKSSNFEIDGEPVMDIAVGSFDDESLSRVQPERHMWWNSGIGWVKDLLRSDGKVCMKHPTGSPFELVKENEGEGEEEGTL